MKLTALMEGVILREHYEEVDEYVSARIWERRRRPWYAFRDRSVAKDIMNVCAANWVAVESGQLTNRDIRKLVVGNPFLILIAQILIPIIIELIKKWLENRDK